MDQFPNARLVGILCDEQKWRLGKKPIECIIVLYFSSVTFSSLRDPEALFVNNHQDTPKDAPDPTDKGKKELKQTDDDIRSFTVVHHTAKNRPDPCKNTKSDVRVLCIRVLKTEEEEIDKAEEDLSTAIVDVRRLGSHKTKCEHFVGGVCRYFGDQQWLE